MSVNSRANLQPDVGVLIAAGGVGSRSGTAAPKQFHPIAGVPMLLRCVRPFAQHPRVGQIVVALPKSAISQPPSWLTSLVGDRLKLVEGGPTRAESVRAAFTALGTAVAIVLVHDAARPFVARDTIDAVLNLASECGVVPVMPVTDTLKRSDSCTGQIVETVDRAKLWRAQTPQGFPREVLQQAYERAGPSRLRDSTDEAALLEAAGFEVRLVPGAARNIKVTTATDIAIAELLARE
ncbi:MAG: 2-C-methyl-D-erythritol 4-phosphate cytidylyltransferase [Gemmatimonadales bacterium]